VRGQTGRYGARHDAEDDEDRRALADPAAGGRGIMTANRAQLIEMADAAAAQGRAGEARHLLRAAIDQGAADADLWLKLAAMCRAEGATRAALEATTGALSVDPLHFVALLLHANLLEKLGEPAAGEAYGRALAQKPDGDLPLAIDRMVDHAAEQYRTHQDSLGSRLSAGLAPILRRAAPEEVRRMNRFRTNTARLTRTYHSQPTHYHYPGLVEREFHDRSAFPWIEDIERATEAIAADLDRVLAAERRELVPYVQYAEGAPLRQWQALNHSLDWSAIHLLKNGARVEANARHCEATLAMLARLPQPDISGLSPNAMFSVLAPGAHIPPHTGVANTRLVCHLPLVVPPGCWFRVGDETREWRRGEGWIFDDTIEHEAANESDATRIILIFDVWHPDLTAIEREAVARVVMDHDRQFGDAL
jgi:aspartyl/asparaginyl beta-hydroxylase (cupin superfamily)